MSPVAAVMAAGGDDARASETRASGGEAVLPIEFRLDPASGVPTYLQLVQQVEQALRLGYLRPGDQSPRVKDVVAGLAINRVAFVAQDAPLYKNLSVADMLHLTRNLNRRWDDGRARARLAELDIPLTRKVGKLSGGQQAQLALTLALARRPDLLILDEPLARLDPLARHDFLASLMAVVAEEGLSVVFSSHVVSELERVADYLIVLSRGRVQVAGEVENLLAGHRLLTGPAEKTEAIAKRLPLVRAQRAQRQAQLFVRTNGGGDFVPEGFESHPVSLEELVLNYLREPDAAALPGPQAPVGVGPVKAR